MYSVIFVALFIGAACAGGVDKDAPIESQALDVGLDGNFENSWSGNGITVHESGSSKIIDNKETQVIQGEYEYTAPDGTHVKTIYISDENGSRVEGAHLPTPPPPQEIPAYIARAIEWAAAHPYKEEPEPKHSH